MTNIGLLEHLNALKIDFIETAVGDRHIAEAMYEYKLSLGGESSGHVIISEYGDSGDGVITALELLSAMRDLGCRASSLRSKIRKYPCCNVSLTADSAVKEKFAACGEIDEFIAREREALSKDGRARIVVRPSGTEPKIRISVECKDADDAKSSAIRIQSKICALLDIKA
jgi:phosphoglucosamine mutase